MRLRTLAGVLLPLALAASFRSADSPIGPSGPPLPGFAGVLAGLSARGRWDPAVLGYEVLAAVTLPGPERDRLGGILRDHPLPEAGPAVLEAEDGLARAMGPVPAAERDLLWMMAGEPGMPVGLRCRLVRILDRLESEPARLIPLLRPELRASAWEAAVRLGRGGGAEAEAALREAVRTWRRWGRQYPIMALVLRRDTAALDLIKEAGADGSPAVRRQTVIAIGSLGTAAELPWIDAQVRAHPDPAMIRVGLDAKRRIMSRERPQT